MDEEQIILMLREIRADIKDIKADIVDFKADTEKSFSILRSAVTNIEQTHGPLLKAMADAQIIYEENHYDHEPRIINLEEITRQHDIKISHLLHQP